ncbi:MAG: acetoacetate decarboxylase family protein [Myxococcota bacterium]
MKYDSYLDPHPSHRDRWSLRRTRDFVSGSGRSLSAYWTDSRYLAFDAEIDPGTAHAWLPPKLRPSDPPRARIFAADYPKTGLGLDYREVGVLLHARLRGKPVLHVAWMVVDDDTALILGRELLGFPKKMAEIDLRIAEDSACLRVRRRGVDLLTLSGVLGDPISETKVFPHPIANVRGIPSLVPSVLFRMDPGERFHSGRAARFEFEVKDSAFDPLVELNVGGSHRGFHAIVDLSPKDSEGRRSPTFRVWPVAGFVRPSWLLRAYPFRAW